MILLRSYRLDDGSDVVSVWHARESGKVKAGLAARMVHLRQQPREGWIRPPYDILKSADGIGAVRWKVERIQHRGLGYFGPGRNEFTFLLFTTKADGYDDIDIKHARTRRSNVEHNMSLSVVVKDRWGQ